MKKPEFTDIENLNGKAMYRGRAKEMGAAAGGTAFGPDQSG